MRPRSGRSTPASMLSTDVFPIPDGPNSAVTPAPDSNATSRSMAGQDFATRTSNVMALLHVRVAAGKKVGSQQCSEREGDRQQRESHGRCVAGGRLQQAVDRDRN